MKLGIVWLRRPVLDAVDRRRGPKSREEFIADAVASHAGRQASGGGVISGEIGEPRFTPPGLVKSDLEAEPLRDSWPIFPLSEGEDG